MIRYRMMILLITRWMISVRHGGLSMDTSTDRQVNGRYLYTYMLGLQQLECTRLRVGTEGEY